MTYKEKSLYYYKLLLNAYSIYSDNPFRPEAREEWEDLKRKKKELDDYMKANKLEDALYID